MASGGEVTVADLIEWRLFEVIVMAELEKKIETGHLCTSVLMSSMKFIQSMLSILEHSVSMTSSQSSSKLSPGSISMCLEYSFHDIDDVTRRTKWFMSIEIIHEHLIVSGESSRRLLVVNMSNEQDVIDWFAPKRSSTAENTWVQYSNFINSSMFFLLN